MNSRQEKLLAAIINQYVASSQPVSSQSILEQGLFGVSSATIRNEMAALEDEGYIRHPHTSAGRVPTEKGYSFLIEHTLRDSLPTAGQQQALKKSLGSPAKFEPQQIKSLAKEMAELANGAVFVAFATNDYYYTGLSNLFGQPEFVEHRLVHHLTKVIDHFDQVIYQIFGDLKNEAEVLIGSQNPFSPDCSAVIAKFNTPAEGGIIGIIGPIRMNYQKNYNLIKYSRELINNLS